MFDIKLTSKGDFSKTYRFLKKIHSKSYYKKLNEYGKLGVEALKDATPKRTGKTAESWSYLVTYSHDTVTINWTNSNVNKGLYIAVLIQYGHGTRNGGYVQGIDFINPAMRPVFEKIADDLWEEVTSDE